MLYMSYLGAIMFSYQEARDCTYQTALLLPAATLPIEEALYHWVLPLYNVGYIAAGTPKSLTFSQN